MASTLADNLSRKSGCLRADAGTVASTNTYRLVLSVCGIRSDHRARRTHVPHSSGFAYDERVLALPQQQEIVGVHPHDFIGCRQPAGGDVTAGTFRAGAVAENARRTGRAERLIFDGGVADRARQHVGSGKIVDPEVWIMPALDMKVPAHSP